MGFSLAPETQAAIAGALEVFSKVSRERVRVELVKLLAASRPSLGLLPMAATGLPTVDDVPVPVITSTQWANVPVAWAKNLHRAASAV